MAIRELQRLFGATATITRRAVVVRRLTATSYELREDGSGRIFSAAAEKTSFYPPGAAVTVAGDTITGSGRALGSMRTVEV